MSGGAEGEADRIAELVAGCEAIADPALRADVLELLGRVLELHAAGLRRIFAAAAEAPHIEAARAAWARDPAIATLVELHGLELPNFDPPRAAPRPAAADFVPLTALTAVG